MPLWFYPASGVSPRYWIDYCQHCSYIRDVAQPKIPCHRYDGKGLDYSKRHLLCDIPLMAYRRNHTKSCSNSGRIEKMIWKDWLDKCAKYVIKISVEDVSNLAKWPLKSCKSLGGRHLIASKPDCPYTSAMPSHNYIDWVTNMKILRALEIPPFEDLYSIGNKRLLLIVS